MLEFKLFPDAEFFLRCLLFLGRARSTPPPECAMQLHAAGSDRSRPERDRLLQVNAGVTNARGSAIRSGAPGHAPIGSQLPQVLLAPSLFQREPHLEQSKVAPAMNMIEQI